MNQKVKELIDKAISKIGINKVRKTILNNPNEINNEIIEYLDDLLMKQRDDRLSSLLGERKIYKFLEFNIKKRESK